jgi:beta-lactamase superfamily II metal-dependent hydrolase
MNGHFNINKFQIVTIFITLVLVGVYLISSTVLFAESSVMDSSVSGGTGHQGSRESSGLSITCINVSKGDSTLITVPSGKTMLVDTAIDGTPVLEVLREKGIERIDYLVSTHWDSDHIGGTWEIAAGEDRELNTNDDIEISNAIDRGREEEKDNSYVDDYLWTLDEKNIPRSTPDIGDIIDLGEGVSATCVTLNGEVLGGRTADWDLGENAKSLGYLISYGTFDFLVCGDLTWGVEELLVPGLGDVEIDVLHLNHHGSYSSSTWDFVEGVRPENAVVSVGFTNSYGHPHREVIDNLEYLESPCGDEWFQHLYMTETGSGNSTGAGLITVHGDIEIEIIGDRYEINGDSYPTDEADADGDAMPDIWEIHMGLDLNDPTDADADRDADGLSEPDEYLWWTCPLLNDTDSDGMPDGWEAEYGLDPLQKDHRGDPDGDGLANEYEYKINTNPALDDTDGDGLDDKQEAFDYLTSPLLNDTDGDGLTDYDEVDTHLTSPMRSDTDGDRLNDGEEVSVYFTDPLYEDSDQDGMPDGWEVIYGLDPRSPLDANEDADNDNISNLQEYMDGTEPGVPQLPVDWNTTHPGDDNGNKTKGNGTGGEVEDEDNPVLLYIVVAIIILIFGVMVLFFIKAGGKS